MSGAERIGAYPAGQAAARRGLAALEGETTRVQLAEYIAALEGVREHLWAFIGDADMRHFLRMVLAGEVEAMVRLQGDLDVPRPEGGSS